MRSELAANVVAQSVGRFGAVFGVEVVGGESAAFVGGGGVMVIANTHRNSAARSRRIIMLSHEAG